MPTLGKFQRVDLREVWEDEASKFTPWLAEEDSLALLGETIGIDLELEATEKDVGPFRADILCKDTDTGQWILIENQLGRTDHGHLGQLLTYAAGLNAVTIVWIAAPFTDEHRATLDWLNDITDDQFQFFGLEIEAWRIGDSLPAPKFNIVAKPNDWSRSVTLGVRSIEAQDLSNTRKLQLDYWTTLQPVIEERGGPVRVTRRPWPRSWCGFRVGRSDFKLSAVMLRQRNSIRAELYISGDDAKAFFHLLFLQREEVETELGYALSWEKLPNRRDARIGIYLENLDPEDRADWARQHEWLADRLNDLHRVLASRIRHLNPEDWYSEAGEPTAE